MLELLRRQHYLGLVQAFDLFGSRHGGDQQGKYKERDTGIHDAPAPGKTPAF